MIRGLGTTDLGGFKHYSFNVLVLEVLLFFGGFFTCFAH